MSLNGSIPVGCSTSLDGRLCAGSEIELVHIPLTGWMVEIRLVHIPLTGW